MHAFKILSYLLLICGVSFAFAEGVTSDYTFLDRLACEAGTDKSSAFHNYTKVYAKYFAPLREKPLTFLEIGIYQGNSVKLWENYFPNATLHFIDQDTTHIEYFSQRSHYHFLDQANKAALHAFAQHCGSAFDIIIDDGGHTMVQQKSSFKALFPYLSSGGLYIIEDTHTSYWLSHGGFGTSEMPRSGPGTTIEFLKSLVDDLNFGGARSRCADHSKIPGEIRATLSEYQDKIESIHFYDSLCIIIKR